MKPAADMMPALRRYSPWTLIARGGSAASFCLCYKTHNIEGNRRLSIGRASAAWATDASEPATIILVKIDILALATRQIFLAFHFGGIH